MTRSEIIIWAFLAIAIALSFLVMSVTASPAHATDWDWSIGNGSGYHHQKPRRKVRRSKPKPELRYYAPPRPEFDREERFCLGPVRGVGTQWIGTEGALDAAKKDWTERTRYDHGEVFLDMTHAVGFRSRCGRTSVGSVAGQVLFRCEVWARPCKADFADGEAGK